MRSTPKGLRLHIGIFGRRNVGKSSVINALAGQQVSIVSEIPGTTTDPVERPMELQPIGPVVLIDTAGIDDVGALGQARVLRTAQVLDRTDLAIVIAEPQVWTEYEDQIIQLLTSRRIPTILAVNKIDLKPNQTVPPNLKDQGIQVVAISARQSIGIDKLRDAVVAATPAELMEQRPIIGDLVGPGKVAVLVVPIDKQAPKGRLILPQVQVIRDLLDHGAAGLVVRDKELASTLGRLTHDPAIVVTDSQAFPYVEQIVPRYVPLTSFSILFARYKGDLNAMVEGVLAIDRLRPGDRVLIAESCSHHPVEDDIATVKIPSWLGKYVGGQLDFHLTRGHDFPTDLSAYKLVIQCGGCMTNRKEIITRIMVARQQGVPITNYGLVIAFSLGLLERALAPFPEALELYKTKKGL